jgi:hypothetical protein
MVPAFPNSKQRSNVEDLSMNIRTLVMFIAGLALNEKAYVRNGLRDVQSSIRKKERG